MSEVPVLRTERLVLREHRAEDLNDYLALWTNEDVVSFITGKPLEMHDCWARILRFRGLWSLIGCGFWIIEEARTGRLVGEAGVMDMRRPIEPSLDGTLEAGWALLPSTHGQGLAGEAMEAILDWTDRYRPETTLSCIIAEPNMPSIRLAGRLGFRETARGTSQDATVIHYRRTPGG